MVCYIYTPLLPGFFYRLNISNKAQYFIKLSVIHDGHILVINQLNAQILVL